jgi:hypothetical protein
MLILNCPREIFHPLVSNKVFCELGVYKGRYVGDLLKFDPKMAYLVDSWDMPNINELIPSDSYDSDPKEKILNTFARYYPDGVEISISQAYEDIKNKFSHLKNIKIIKKNQKDALHDFEDHSIDFLHYDSNMRFDFVLANLERYQHKIHPEGFMVICNAYVAELARAQYITALEAVSNFLKNNHWVAVAYCNAQFSSVLITRPDNFVNLTLNIMALADKNNIPFIEVPNEMIHSARHKNFIIDNNKKEFLSFGF